VLFEARFAEKTAAKQAKPTAMSSFGRKNRSLPGIFWP
jgi:hypothetical protein